MTKQKIIALMESSKSEEEWNANCELVKEKCNGYPSFWYETIVLSKIAQKVAAKWDSDAEIHINHKFI